MHLIDRDSFRVCAACNKQFPDEPCEPSECEIIMELDRLPSIDAAPVVHGAWIKHEDDWGLTYECSHCHAEGMLYGNYCPNCGAKMDLEEKQNAE